MKNLNEPSIAHLSCAFLHLGLTAFGGLAMVEPLRRMSVDKQRLAAPGGILGWPGLVSDAARSHGGATGNLYRIPAPAGKPAPSPRPGSFILPGFILMLALSFLYFRYTDISWVQAVSRGMSCVVIALLLQALWRLSQAIRKHWLDVVIALLALGAFGLRINFLLVFLGAGLLRMALGLWLLPVQVPGNPMVATVNQSWAGPWPWLPWPCSGLAWGSGV